jgi:hypothetical protein
MIIHNWISSDGSELVPTTDVKINLTLPYLPFLSLFLFLFPFLFLFEVPVPRGKRAGQGKILGDETLKLRRENWLHRIVLVLGPPSGLQLGIGISGHLPPRFEIRAQAVVRRSPAIARTPGARTHLPQISER